MLLQTNLCKGVDFIYKICIIDLCLVKLPIKQEKPRKSPEWALPGKNQKRENIPLA